MTTETQVSISSYLQTRQHNEVLFNRLVKKIETNLKKELKANGNLKIIIGMSAKTQTPYVKVGENDKAPSNIDHLETVIENAIIDVGFTPMENESKPSGYFINFED
jgi:hypothetical protein